MNPVTAVPTVRVAPEAPFIEWTQADVHQSVARRFEQQVELGPERIAVRSENAALTYDQLNRLVNRIAHALLARNAEPGQRIALLLAHDVPLFAALLGVLKAGQVCVVLSPAHPEARLAGLLEKAGATGLLTDAPHAALAARLAGDARPVLQVDLLDAAWPENNPGLDLSPEAPAFIIFTSGSTGQPRGVLQTHQNILHNIRRHTHGLHLHAPDRIALLSSASAGQGMATVFSALLNGAMLCPRDVAEEGVTGLADWMVREKITVYISAATVFRHFIRSLTGRESFPNLRLVRLASEPVHQRDLELFQKYFPPGCIFANTYSSTETGNLCQFFWNQQAPLPGDVMPIGYPADGIEILLLDEQGQPVADGAVGEIVVRSRYLSPGYWNEPAQTSAAFQTVPGHEERLYFTRDLGRRHPDGSLEHMGRRDTQLKIRGYRVYPDEIQNRLVQHPSVSDALVDARPDASGQARLVAYLIPRAQHPSDARELRRFLRATLPEFMVPSAFLFLEAFPRTPNGKVERSALAALPLPNASAAGPADQPRTPVEELLAVAWAEVLNRDTVGIHDNFFELGGDSLLITQLLVRIKELVHVDLPLALLFEKSTVAEMGDFLASGQQDQEDVPPITAAPRGRPLPLSFVQERNWRQSRSLLDSLSNLLANGYVLEGALDVAALQRSLDEVVRRHEPLRTTYANTPGGLVQHIGAPAPVHWRILDLRSHPQPEVEADRLWSEEARTPINLEHGPVIRSTLLRLGEERHWWLVTVHHIISDAWSRDNVLRDLGLLYAAFTAGRPSPLPEPALHFADFAVWQRERLRPDGALFQNQLAYWKKQLADAPKKLELPFARATPPATTDYREGRLRWKIPTELARQLQALGQREGATLFMTRLAAFAVHLNHLTGAEDLVVATYMTNRNRVETQGMIGFFSNLVMLRLDLRGNPTFRELLARVRATTLAATAHADLPFDELCAELKKAKVKPPKIQIIFEVKYGDTSRRFGDIAVRRMERKTSTMPWGLQWGVFNHGERDQGLCLIDTRIYDPAAVTQTIAGLENLLTAIAAHPDRRLAELNPVKPKRRRWLFGF